MRGVVGLQAMMIRCPICLKMATWEENRWRPFCSERCKMVDLGNWASDAYRIPGKPENSDDDDIPDEDSSTGAP